MSRLINPTYFEWYEFDVNVVHVVSATSTYESTLSTNELEQLNIQNFMRAYE